MRSIRAALLLGTISGSAAVFLVVMAALFVLLRSLIVDQFDSSLRETALSLSYSFEQIPEGLRLELGEFDMREFRKAERPAYFEAWLDSGRVIYRSPSLGEKDLPRFSEPADAPAFRWLELPDGRPGRAIGLAFVPRADDHEDDDDGGENTEGGTEKRASRRVTLVLARDAAPIDGPWKTFGTLLGLVGGTALALFAGVLWIIIRRNLRPLVRIAGEIEKLDPEDLSARIRLNHPSLEIQPIADRLNDLLGKLEGAFERERALTADAAHELRTPIAGIRSTVDVALSRPRLPEQYREALGECRTITIQMQQMVDNLLSLARIEAGQVSIDQRTFSLDERLKAAWSLLEPMAASRGLEVMWSLDGGIHATSDPALLDIVLQNLLQNALEHVNERGTIAIAAAAAPEGLDIRVRNTGSRLTQEQADRVFDRFWRGDSARSNAGAHCGIGLALVKSITSLLGGSARARSQAGGEFEIIVNIPGRPEPSQQDGEDSSKEN